MPKTRAQIRHDPVSSEVWQEPRIAVMDFDPRQIRPLGDHILVELDEATEKTITIVVPDIARNRDIGTRTGVVLAVGPGKYKEKLSGIEREGPLSWVLPKLVFKPTTLRPGDRVAIGHFSDWESWNCSADGHQTRDNNIVLCQEADVRLIRNTEGN